MNWDAKRENMAANSKLVKELHKIVGVNGDSTNFKRRILPCYEKYFHALKHRTLING